MQNQKFEIEETEEFMENRFQNSLNLESHITLKKIFELSEKEQQIFKSCFNKCETIEWPSEFTEEDLSLSKKFNFDIKKCVAEDDFVKFNFSKSEAHFLIDLINKTLEIETIGSFISCESYFAHLHDDKEAVEHSGQIMVVLENNGKNIVYSVNEDGVETTICPKEGDVLFLNIWEKHAVLPSANKSIKQIKSNPIKLLCFN